MCCLMLFLSFTGCTATLTGGSNPQNPNGLCYYGMKLTLPLLLESTDLKSLFEDIAADLCVDTCSDCVTTVPDGRGGMIHCVDRDAIQRQTVMVTDFVDVQSYVPKRSGLLMGELMRGSLNKICCYKIIQGEFSKYFNLSADGLVVLTRDASQIKDDEYYQHEVVVGTYNYLQDYYHLRRNKLVIFVRRIDTQTGKISKIVTRELNYYCDGREIKYTVR
jgi:hypothetical protein